MTTRICNIDCKNDYVKIRETLDESQAALIKSWTVEIMSGQYVRGHRTHAVMFKSREIIWQGKCCCKWQARVQALETIQDDKSGLVRELLDRLYCKEDREEYRDQFMRLSTKTLKFLIGRV